MKEPLTKIVFRLDASEWHGHAFERVWAEDLGGDQFRLMNSPFHARGYSFMDVVAAMKAGDGDHYVERPIIRGGHSTYRLFVMTSIEDERFQRYWAPLKKLGCTFEGATSRLLSVDVPPGADIHETHELLEVGLQDKFWGLEEGHCGHDTRRDVPERS